MDFFLWLAQRPMWFAAILMLGLGMMASIIGTTMVYARYTTAELASNSIAGGLKYTVFASVYAGFLGLLLYGVYQKYEDVRAYADTEINALETLDQTALAFPKVTRDGLRDALKQYARKVAEVEWPRMQIGKSSPEVKSTLQDMVSTYMAIEPTTEKEAVVFAKSLDVLADIEMNRLNRLRLAQGSMSPLLWGVAVFGTIVAIAFPLFFGSPSLLATLLMSSLLAATNMSVLLVILKLSFPFVGEYGVRPDNFLAFAGG